MGGGQWKAPKNRQTSLLFCYYNVVNGIYAALRYVACHFFHIPLFYNIYFMFSAIVVVILFCCIFANIHRAIQQTTTKFMHTNFLPYRNALRLRETRQQQ